MAPLRGERGLFERHARSWHRVGLGWWAVALREPLGDLPAGSVIGLGGASAALDDLSGWNLGYRLTPRVWGRGLAGELGRAAIAEANRARPGYAGTARALTRNEASWHVLERIGLEKAWEGEVADEGLPAFGLPLRVYADRTPSPEVLAKQIELG